MEIWKDIDGYEGRYRISNKGNIYSYLSKKIMKPSLSSTGYLHIQLYGTNGSSVRLVHKLVAETFLQNPDNKPEVNHKDGNKANNKMENLEKKTKSENQIHAIKHGLRKSSPLEGVFGADNPNSKRILQYNLNGEFIKMWDSISQASKAIGCSESTLASCLHGRIKSCKGFMWKYYDVEIVQNIPPINRKIANNRGHRGPQKNKRACRKIVQCTPDGKFVKEWNSYIELVSETGYDNGNIYACINGRRKSSYGYVWKYSDI